MTTPTKAMAEHRLPPELAYLLKPIKLPFQEWFDKLREEACRYPECFDNPLSIPPNMIRLAEYASRANIANIAKEMARSWGEEHPDASLYNCDSLKVWPAVTLREKPILRFFNRRQLPKNDILGFYELGGSHTVEIRDQDGLLVFTDSPTYIRPGSWIDTLAVEYNRFLQWRRENEVSPTPLPKPIMPMKIS
jgi:hypothetical protein